MSRRFPFPPYPKGWYQVCYSDELAPGATAPLRYFGRELHLSRGDDGAVQVPGHPACEKNGMVLVWHDEEGGPPGFEVPTLAEYGSQEWTPYERRRWRIRTCNQEMAENSVDSAHFRYLHGTQNLPESRAHAEGPVLRVTSTTGMSTPRGGVDGTVESTSYGFGFSTIRFRGIVETLLLGTSVAIDEEHIDLRFSFTVRRLGDVSLTRGVGKAFMAEVTRQLEQDIPIWEHKAYLDRPLLCDGDGPIGTFRRWCRQFYPGSRPRQVAP